MFSRPLGHFLNCRFKLLSVLRADFNVLVVDVITVFERKIAVLYERSEAFYSRFVIGIDE